MTAARARACAALACLALASCAAPPDAPAPGRAAQEAACRAAVAAHVGLPPEAVATAWLAAAPGGGAAFEAVDGGRRHTCETDAAGRVLRIDHPAE